MDQPDLDPQLHAQALLGLRRVNRISSTAWHLWQPIARLAARIPDRPLRVLDLASGGGDVTLKLARHAQRAQIPVSLQGWDISPFAVSYAREQLEQTAFDNVEFHVRDVFDQAETEAFDVVLCSLFLHHLDEPDVVKVLASMSAATRHLVLVDDLHRTWLGYALAWVGCRLVTRSPVVHVDGPRSVAGAFSLKEMNELAQQAGLSGAQLSSHWPERFLLDWRKP